MKAPIKIAIVGFGDRGRTYASMQQLYPEKMKIVAVADIRPERVETAKKLYDIPEENCFASAEEFYRVGKIADVVCVSTMDRQHVDHAIPALELGYDVLMEKPISPDLKKCDEILSAAKKSGRRVVLCHVLRYTAFYNKIKEIIDSGKIGDVVALNATENVGYWHQAHSFVRGNWRNADQTSPMILQKSCHDMDIMMWVTGKTAKSVSSIGGISHFKKECAPEGATPYCLGGCKVKENCIFDAEEIYIKSEKTGIANNAGSWITSVLSEENTVESTYAALKDGQYGRCVYMCDNNVVDHQSVDIEMTDGSTIAFTMCAFTKDCYREFHAKGTRGEIIANMKDNKIVINEFGRDEEVIDLNLQAADLKGHGGGDSGLLSDFLDMLLNDSPPNERTTTLEASMVSHYLALAAEESRVNGGVNIDLEEFKLRSKA